MDPAERFIEVATAPLAETNAELHLAAQHELRERINLQEADALQAAASRLEKVKRPRWIPALLILMGVVSLPIIFLTVRHYQALRVTFNALNFSYSGPEPPPPSIEHLSAEQKLILYGDLSHSGKAERWKALWDSRPEHPPYFVNYVVNYVSQYSALPPDFLETANSIDPENGWYWALAAARGSKGNITKGKLSTKDRDAGKAQTWTIIDPAKHKASLQLIEEAVSKPRFNSYAGDLITEQIPLLPQRTDYMSQFPALFWFAYQVTFSLDLRPISEALAAEAERCQKDDDLEGFRKLQKIHKPFALRTSQDSFFLIDALMAKLFTSAPIRNFRDAAIKLGLDDDAKTYAKIDAFLNPDKKEKERRQDRSSYPDVLAQRKGSLLGSMSFPMISRQSVEPVSFSEDEITPARRAEYALLGRIASLIIWVLLGVALLAVSLFRPQPRISLLARRLRDLLKVSDWFWIIGLGIIAPMIWHLLIAELSTLAAHHWNMKMSGFMLPGAQFAATALLLIITPLVVVRWRLRARTTLLHFNHPRPFLGCLAVALTAAIIPIGGSIPLNDGSGEIAMKAAPMILGYPLLWLAIVIFRSIFFSKDRGIMSRTVMDSLIPAYTVGMIFVILCIPLFHLAEKHWTQFDRISEISIEEPSFTRYEYRVTQQLKSELLESLEKLP